MMEFSVTSIQITQNYQGGIGRILYEEPLLEICQDFTQWRIDPYVRNLEKTKSKGRILPFVRGLRLSARLIYYLRERLDGTNLTANWGHIIDNQGNYCSCECDVIIHKKGCLSKWNGRGSESVMDFRFVNQNKALVVISCKSYLRSNDIDKEYCKQIEPFVKRVWLFSECCGPKSINGIKTKAIRYGYENYWPLYTWSIKTDPTPCRDLWRDFFIEVERLKEQYA